MLKRVPLVRQAGWLAGLAWLTCACSATSPRPPVPVDCAAGDGYELQSMLLFEPGEEMTWFASGDPTGQRAPSPQAEDTTGCATGGAGGSSSSAAAGSGTAGLASASAVTSAAFEPIDGGRCGSTQALVIRSRGHTDWGSLVGNWKIAQTAWEAAGYEGIAFWARAFGDSSATLVLDTWQTSAAGTAGIAQPGEVCIVDCSAGSGTQAIDESGNILTQSYVSPAGTCGNSFQYTLTVTDDWRLYVIPFEAFFQERKPNMSASGLDPSHINGFSFRMAKESGIELWLDDVALYRKK